MSLTLEGLELKHTVEYHYPLPIVLLHVGLFHQQPKRRYHTTHCDLPVTDQLFAFAASGNNWSAYHWQITLFLWLLVVCNKISDIKNRNITKLPIKLISINGKYQYKLYIHLNRTGSFATTMVLKVLSELLIDTLLYRPFTKFDNDAQTNTMRSNIGFKSSGITPDKMC